MRIRDWSSDVCSSDLPPSPAKSRAGSKCFISTIAILEVDGQRHAPLSWASEVSRVIVGERDIAAVERVVLIEQIVHIDGNAHIALRSEEHTSELQSLMRTSYAVFCLKNKTIHYNYIYTFCYSSSNSYI